MLEGGEKDDLISRDNRDIDDGETCSVCEWVPIVGPCDGTGCTAPSCDVVI